MKAYRIALLAALIALGLTAAFAQNSSVIPAGGATPAGADTQIQYNNAGAFGANTNLVTDGFGKITAADKYFVPLKVALGDANGYAVNAANLYSIGWAPSTNVQVAPDTAFYRNAAGVVEVTNGTVNTYREIKLRSVVHGGTAPTNSGACAITTQVGGNTAGTFQASGACTSSTVILTFGFTAPAGWACFTSNRTTVANLLPQTASSTATATFTGTMAANDVVQFSCSAY
jgi:hypothetical protein